MKDQLLLQLVKSVLAQTLNTVSLETIHPHSKLKEDLGLDSMSSLTFLMALEDAIPGFLVDPDTLDASHLEDVENIIRYISQQLGGQQYDNVA
jgi:acyl carrier protein